VNPSIEKLQAALFARCPSLAEILPPGLSAAKIKKALSKAGVEGAIEPIVELYSWRDGCPGGYADSYKMDTTGGFVPARIVPLSASQIEFMRAIGASRVSSPERFHLLGLKRALGHMKDYRDALSRRTVMAALAGRYFPFLWDATSSVYLAIDLNPSAGSRVIKFQHRETLEMWEAYDSFEAFLADAIRCNETNTPMACLVSECKAIELPTADMIVAAQAATKGDVAKAAGARSASADGKIPSGDNPLVLRTDFSDEAAWKSLRGALEKSEDDSAPELDIVSDPTFAGVTPKRLPKLLSKESPLTFAFIIDAAALTQRDHPIQVVDLQEKPGRWFRVVLSELDNVASNLSIANMDFAEFADAVDDDGVFRGFSEP
jgi:hypothetical protein